jgi:hypothetical protein
VQFEALPLENFSTGGIALPYPLAMRTTLQILTLSLLTSITTACDDNTEPTRPADGTVKVWESCVWDGQQEPALCETSLSCSRHGVCSPVCEVISDCPEFEGFDMDCISADLANVCAPKCNPSNECPQTGGAELKCHQFYCIGES